MSVFGVKIKLYFKIERPNIANLQKIIILKYYCIYLFISNTLEVSTTSKVPKIVLSNEAIDLIEELVQIDGVQRFEKEVIFEKLYVMWKCDGLGTITAVKSGFDTNKEFIMKTITRSCKPEVQRDMEMVQKIHGSLLKGEDFTTPEGNIIPSTSDEIDRWHQQRKKYTQMLNRRYNKLCEEFKE